MGKNVVIQLVYHVAIMNNWAEIVQEQLETIAASGLGNVFDHMAVTMVGDKTEEIHSLFRKFPFRRKVELIHSDTDLHSYEFPALEQVQKIARKNPSSKIFYFHAKGVSLYHTSKRDNVRLWRKYMEYFLMQKWEWCLKSLGQFDACGVDFCRSPWGTYFSGNFWWGRGDYLSTCKIDKVNRHHAELFIGTGGYPILKSFHQSGDNPRLDAPQYKHVVKRHFDVKVKQYYTGVLDLYNFGYLPEYYEIL